MEFPNNCSKNWTVHIDIVVAISAFRLHGLIKGRNYSRDIFDLAVPNSKVLNSCVFMGLQWNNRNKSEQKLICLCRFLLFTFILGIFPEKWPFCWSEFLIFYFFSEIWNPLYLCFKFCFWARNKWVKLMRKAKLGNSFISIFALSFPEQSLN